MAGRRLFAADSQGPGLKPPGLEGSRYRTGGYFLRASGPPQQLSASAQAHAPSSLSEHEPTTWSSRLQCSQTYTSPTFISLHVAMTLSFHAPDWSRRRGGCGAARRSDDSLGRGRSSTRRQGEESGRHVAEDSGCVYGVSACRSREPIPAAFTLHPAVGADVKPTSLRGRWRLSSGHRGPCAAPTARTEDLPATRVASGAAVCRPRSSPRELRQAARWRA